MARKPTETQTEEHIVTDADTPGLPAVVEAANQVAAADAVIMDSYEVLMQAGQLQGLDFIRHVEAVATAQIFEKIKASNKFKGLPYKDDDGNIRRVESLDEFCRHFLGKSYTRCFELTQNLHTLGADLYERAEKIGFKARDYQAIKALSADDQEIIRQALAEDSKDKVLEVLQDMAVKHGKEKEALAKQAADALGERDAARRVSEDKQRQVNTLRRELDEAKEKRLTMTPDARLKQARQFVTECAQILETDTAVLYAHLTTLRNLGRELGDEQTAFMAGTLAQSLARLNDVRHALELPEVSDGPAMPEWMKDDSWINANGSPKTGFENLSDEALQALVNGQKANET